MATSVALEENADRCERWRKLTSAVMKLLGNIKSKEIDLDLQDIYHLDSLLYSMETTAQEESGLGRMDQRLLSRAWVSLSYEFLRLIKQRVQSTKKADRKLDWTDELDNLFKQIEALRMLLVKHELASVGKKGEQTIIEQVTAAGERAEDYRHGQSLLSEHVYSRDIDNSIGWLIYMNNATNPVYTYRKDISDALLKSLENLSV